MSRPARPWFRFYVEAVHDRKLRRLKPEHRWLFVVFLAAARQSPEPGWLLVSVDDPMTWDDLVDFAAMPLKQVEQGSDALHSAGVVGWDKDREAWFIPSWNARQFESDDVTARTTKHRSKERSKGVRGNAPETETDTETDTDKGQTLLSSPQAGPTTVDPVADVFVAWQQATNRPRSRLTPDRRRRIKKAISTYGHDMCLDAVQGVTLSAFHMGNNDRGARYDTIEVVFKNASNVERFAELNNGAVEQPMSTKAAQTAQVLNGFLARTAIDVKEITE